MEPVIIQVSLKNECYVDTIFDLDKVKFDRASRTFINNELERAFGKRSRTLQTSVWQFLTKDQLTSMEEFANFMIMNAPSISQSNLLRFLNNIQLYLNKRQNMLLLKIDQQSVLSCCLLDH